MGLRTSCSMLRAPRFSSRPKGVMKSPNPLMPRSKEQEAGSRNGTPNFLLHASCSSLLITTKGSDEKPKSINAEKQGAGSRKQEWDSELLAPCFVLLASHHDQRE